MQTRTLGTASTVLGYCAAGCAFILSALFLTDVFGEYFVNTSYFFALGMWYEFAIAIVAVAAFVAVVGWLYYRRR
jgi:hypothetical protein